MKLLKKIGFQNLILFLVVISVFLLIVKFQDAFQTSIYDYKITKRFSLVSGVFQDREEKKLEDLLRDQIRLITTRRSFRNSLAVVEKHEEKIRQEAEKKGFPEELSLGVALLENGGSEKAVSSAGAAGIFQLLQSTAQTLGLKVEEGNDERLDPDKNITAGLDYLSKNMELFGDSGLAVWAHHAGPQNVSRAIKIYTQSKRLNETLTYREALDQGKLPEAKKSWKNLVANGLDVHKLLQDEEVKKFTSTLSDQSGLYTYKAVAAAIIFESSKNQSEFLNKVTDFNKGRILLAELLEK